MNYNGIFTQLAFYNIVREDILLCVEQNVLNLLKNRIHIMDLLVKSLSIHVRLKPEFRLRSPFAMFLELNMGNNIQVF